MRHLEMVLLIGLALPQSMRAQDPAMPPMGATSGPAAARPPADSLKSSRQIRAYLESIQVGQTPDLAG